MNFFRACGKDESSDKGYWDVIILAKDLQAVAERMPEYLRSIGRTDLILGMMIQKIDPGQFGDPNVIWHTIEKGGE
jgi:hypothetical protein